MKRYVMLITFTLVIIAGIIIFGKFQNPFGVEVGVYKVKTKLIEQTVTCTGRVEEAESEDVYVKIPCIVDNIYVKEGDKIEKGDLMFSVDVEATKQVISAASGISPALVPDEQIEKEITAPISGEVRSINISSGEIINTDSPCAVISSSDALQVKVAIQESRLKNIKLGQAATVSGTAFALNEYKGVVSYISPTARQQYVGTTTETVVDAIISLTEKDESLKPGLSAKSKILVGSCKDSIVIPYEYVMQDEFNNEYVYLYKDEYSVKCIIKTGKELGDGFEIISGLSPGDLVIINPDNIENEGEKVRLITGEGRAVE
ncbi:MAG: efflux RND transporter periplasmic adaptor subunit [Oscillospiraceae bacterium]|nr:efflux RND transporter periplasmic adaptor subunit [Oscillospiraceae bacterium]MDD4414265.1 efflux RND transporter periplasmic adaptor subunit [Oscillospiraceae bacterium]